MSQSNTTKCIRISEATLRLLGEHTALNTIPDPELEPEAGPQTERYYFIDIDEELYNELRSEAIPQQETFDQVLNRISRARS